MKNKTKGIVTLRKILYNERHNCKCLICNKIIFRLELHHLNKNRKDNRLENIIIICKKCHMLIHHPQKINHHWEHNTQEKIYKLNRIIEKLPREKSI